MIIRGNQSYIHLVKVHLPVNQSRIYLVKVHLPVICDCKQLFEAELSHVTLSSHQRVNVHKNITAINNTVHLMYPVQHHLKQTCNSNVLDASAAIMGP